MFMTPHLERPASGGHGRAPALLLRHWPALILIGISIPLILMNLGQYSLINGDEEIYHVVARTMVESGNWLHLQFYDQHRVYDTFMNAPLQYWARAALISIFGSNMWTARILSALFAIASVLMTYRLGLHLSGQRRVAFLAGFVQLTTFQFIYLHSARTGELEPVITFLYTLIALLFMRCIESGKSFIPHHLCLALLLNLKAPTVLIPLLAESACFVLMPSTRSALRRFASSAALILPLGLTWHASRIIALWQPFLDVVSEMAGQAASHRQGGPLISRYMNIRFYGATMLFGAFPYVLVYPLALIDVLRETDSDEERLRWRVLAAFVAAVLVFYVFVSKHHHWYVIPTYPLLSLFLASWLFRLPARRASTLLLLGVSVVAGILLYAMPNLGYNPFALKSWNIPMRLYWRELPGPDPLIGLGVCTTLIAAALFWLRRRFPTRLAGVLALTLTLVLTSYALRRSWIPLRYLGHQSSMALLRAELDELERQGSLPAYPIEPSVGLGWDGRYYLGDRYRIVMRGARQFALYPKEDESAPGR